MSPSRYSLSIVAAAFLASCGGSQPPIGAPGAMLQTSALATHSDRGKSWMLPEAKNEDLLYVADQNSGDVYVFTYPGGKVVGSLTGFNDPGGECVDTSGDVFVTNFGGQDILEYAHGSTKLVATLSDSGARPSGCSFDPTTGNLAVANIDGPYNGGYHHGDIAIYAHASGTPETYRDKNIYWYVYCAYDHHGNLFVDGYKPYSNFLVAELRKGSEKLESVKITNPGLGAGSLQWDGKYLVVGDDQGAGAGQRGPQLIDQITVSGDKGMVANTIALSDEANQNPGTVVQAWIQGDKIIQPDAGGLTCCPDPTFVEIWRYPAGGEPIKTISGFEYAIGVTVSPSRHSPDK